MRLLLICVLFVSSLVAGLGAVQGRPVFTGLWKFVADQSVPLSKGALGKEFRITQESNALVLEVPVTQVKKTEDGKWVLVPDAALSEPMVYKLDGKEHVLTLDPRMSLPDGSSGINSILGGPYRVSWDGNALVIAGSDEIPYTSFRDGAILEMVRRKFSITFSMNPDGTLLVERTVERDPADKGRIEVRKAELRSLYRKTS